MSAVLQSGPGALIRGELSKLRGRKVKIVLVDGKSYTGILRDIDYPSLHLVLQDVDTGESREALVFINGSRVAEIRAAETTLFEPREFARYLVERLGLRPDAVRVLDDAGVVLVYNTIKVTETGVEGTGGLVPKISFVLKEYLEKKRRGERPL